MKRIDSKTSLALLSISTLILAMTLMNIRIFFEDTPDIVVRIIGAAMLATVSMMVFFSAKSVSQHGKSKNNQEKE